MTTALMPGREATPLGLAKGLGISCAQLQAGLWLAVSPTRAGFPSPAADDRVVRIDLNAALVRHEEATVLVRVKGDSMRDEGILDGNVLLVDKALSAQHGDIVVAVLDGEFTVKALYRKDGMVKLLPANPDYPEIVPAEGQELRIWGVVISTIRQFR
jgi:DNA polymerase V